MGLSNGIWKWNTIVKNILKADVKSTICVRGKSCAGFSDHVFGATVVIS